jgi:hypothetical protein
MLVCSKFGQECILCMQCYERKDVYVININYRSFYAKWMEVREKFKSIRVILQKLVSVVKLQNYV